MKFYFQVIIDNFSSFILTWQVVENISEFNTINLIKDVKQKFLIKDKTQQSSLVTNGGPENTDGIVTTFLSSANQQRLITGKDIEYSNTMIESFFNSLIKNYFNTQKNSSIDDVVRKIKFYVN